MLYTGVYHLPVTAPLHDGTPVMATSYRRPTASTSNGKDGAAPSSTPISGDRQPISVRRDRKLLDRFRDKVRSLHYIDFGDGEGLPPLGR